MLALLSFLRDEKFYFSQEPLLWGNNFKFAMGEEVFMNYGIILHFNRKEFCKEKD